MKYLCVCQYGHCRSVYCARALQARGHEAASVGWGTAPSALRLLQGWADTIIVMEACFTDKIDPGFRNRVVCLDVGPDRWVNPYHPELRSLIDNLLNGVGL